MDAVSLPWCLTLGNGTVLTLGNETVLTLGNVTVLTLGNGTVLTLENGTVLILVDCFRLTPCTLFSRPLYSIPPDSSSLTFLSSLPLLSDSLPSLTCFSDSPPLPPPLYSSLFPRVCVRAVSVQWIAFWNRHSEILRRPRPCFAILSVPVRSVLPLRKGDAADVSPPSNVFSCVVASSLVPRLPHSGRFLIKHSCRRAWERGYKHSYMNYSSLVPRPRGLGTRLELRKI